MSYVSYPDQQNSLPYFGLLALGVSLTAYISTQVNLIQLSAFTTGLVLLVAGGIQIAIGMCSQQQGRSYAAATLLPFGLFWLSMIGYEIFPELGYGHHPSAIAMFAYLSIWGLFVALLFLGSFRESLSIQTLYGTMMICLMSMSIDQLRDDQVFHIIGCIFGIFAAFIAIYTALAQLSEHLTGRNFLPRTTDSTGPGNSKT